MFLLCIMDGFGLRSEKGNNAIAAAQTPNLDRLFTQWPHRPIEASAQPVGLPEGQMGNSEVGHLNIGAGRIVFQEISRIDRSIADGSFFKNETLLESFKKTIKDNKSIHLLGLVSDGCVHSSLNHIDALVKMAADLKAPRLYLHAFLDGRDTPPTSGAGYIEEVEAIFKEYGIGRISTLMGRYWGMDRDKRWARIERAYAAIVYGEGNKSVDPVTAVRDSYAKDVTDEFVEPVVFGRDDDKARLKSGDLALFFNFRSDRVRQLNHVLEGNQSLPIMTTKKDAEKLKVNLINMTLYDEKLKTPKIVFPPMKLEQVFGEVISKNGLKQLRIAETEKYAHVTYFFNGGEETPFDNEVRMLVQSPKVATYDLQPEMSAPEVTEKVVDAISGGQFDIIILNFANCDMVGHTGIWEAAIKAVETVDKCVGKVFDTLLAQNGAGILTADHGNVDLMVDSSTGQPHTAHTTNPVPFVLVNGPAGSDIRSGGKLADIAPTILDILKIEKPIEMTGESLLLK